MANVTVRRQDGGEGEIQQQQTQRRAVHPFRMLRDLLGFDPFQQMSPLIQQREMAFLPDFEIKETKDALIFKADMPGVEQNDLDITIDGRRLVVAGHREMEKEQRDETFYAVERAYGNFTRAFTLPDGLDTDRVQAALDKGVLTLHIPKSQQAKAKKVEIGKSTPGAKA
jgi:HSP20 family protein